MNILDITQADIERLKENKIVFGLLPERDREIFGVFGYRQYRKILFERLFPLHSRRGI